MREWGAPPSVVGPPERAKAPVGTRTEKGGELDTLAKPAGPLGTDPRHPSAGPGCLLYPEAQRWDWLSLLISVGVLHSTRVF